MEGNKNIKIAKVDCTENKDVCKDHGVCILSAILQTKYIESMSVLCETNVDQYSTKLLVYVGPTSS